MDKAEKFWDRTARSYDQEEKKDEPTYMTIIDKTKRYLKTSDVLLDFACGTGLVSNEIAGNVSIVHAIDISSNMIEIARKKAEGRGLKNIEYAHATLFDERYQRGSFDVILAFYILHLVEDADQVMQRFHELLKPGGLLISATPCMGEKKAFQSGLLLALSKIGFAPKIRSFKVSELEAVFAHGDFEIVEAECLRQEYFIAAKKI